MKGNSDHHPEILVKDSGKTQVRYDIKEVTKTDMDGKERTSYDYSYVDIIGEVTRNKIISAIIGDSYDLSAELAHLNNVMQKDKDIAKAKQYEDEYTEYTKVRSHAKDVATTVLEGKD